MKKITLQLTVFDQRVERQLDWDPCIEHDDLPRRTQHAETVVLSQEHINRMPPGLPHDLLLVR